MNVQCAIQSSVSFKLHSSSVYSSFFSVYSIFFKQQAGAIDLNSMCKTNASNYLEEDISLVQQAMPDVKGARISCFYIVCMQYGKQSTLA